MRYERPIEETHRMPAGLPKWLKNQYRHPIEKCTIKDCRYCKGEVK